MDREDLRMFSTIGAILLGALLILGLIGGFADRAICHASFSGSHLQVRWGIISGCQVEVPGAGWIPADNYRAIQ